MKKFNLSIDIDLPYQSFDEIDNKFKSFLKSNTQTHKNEI